MKPKEYRIFRLQDGDIRDNGTRIDTLKALKECLQGEDIAIMPVGDAPENWQDMTITGGKLVPASDEEIAARSEMAISQEKSKISAARKERYAQETDPLLFGILEEMAAQYPELLPWVEAKEQIRQEIPKI